MCRVPLTAVLNFVVFFEHKTADEMRIIVCISDVCSSDLGWRTARRAAAARDPAPARAPAPRAAAGRPKARAGRRAPSLPARPAPASPPPAPRSEEHTSELQSLMRISYAVFCLKKTTKLTTQTYNSQTHTPIHTQHTKKHRTNKRHKY